MSTWGSYSISLPVLNGRVLLGGYQIQMMRNVAALAGSGLWEPA